MLQIGPANRKEKMLAITDLKPPLEPIDHGRTGSDQIYIQVSLDLFQGPKLSFHHFEVENKECGGRERVGGPNIFFFSVFSVSISDGKSQPWQYRIWLELPRYQYQVKLYLCI